jgi:hypothetical protein
MVTAKDLTRWNRAGLARFRYVDGNGVTFLDQLRTDLETAFPSGSVSPTADATDADRLARLEAAYLAPGANLLDDLNRAFARAGHVLTEHVDTFANEGFLNTATQWESLRRLVQMLNYRPHPPASAYTSLALIAKPNSQGKLPKGFQIASKPTDGKAPVVFETLEDLTVDARLNRLYADGYQCNPGELKSPVLEFDNSLPEFKPGIPLKTGEPLVLEEEGGQKRLSAHIIQNVITDGSTTKVRVSPDLPSFFVIGKTLVHIGPKERLKPLGPITEGAEIGRTLAFTEAPKDLKPGEVVVITVPGKQAHFRRVDSVQDKRVTFSGKVGDLYLVGTQVSRPVVLPIAYIVTRPGKQGGPYLFIVNAAGDWSRLEGTRVADQRVSDDPEVKVKLLPHYLVTHAKYVPLADPSKTTSASSEKGTRPGFTTLTLSWDTGQNNDLGYQPMGFSNPQALLVVPPSLGPWEVDAFLQKSVQGHFATMLDTTPAKKAAPGDLAVVVRGAQAAWTRLGRVEHDADLELTHLNAESAWQDRGGGPFYLRSTQVFTHFALQIHLKDWQENETPIVDRSKFRLMDFPSSLQTGRMLLAKADGTVIKTQVKSIEATTSSIELDPPLPIGTTVGNLVLYGNTVFTGHGESRAVKSLGSGDATKSNQVFTLALQGLSFIPDATMAIGVRADMDIIVSGQTWVQVEALSGSGPSDPHYEVHVTEDENYLILFGDGCHGRRLPTGANNIKVRYRQGNGLTGNLPAGSLTKSIRPHPLVDAFLQLLPSAGGADMETRASIRQAAPAAVLTLQRAVSAKDFAMLSQARSDVWQAHAILLPGSARQELIDVVIVPAGGGKLTLDQRTAISAFLADHALPSVNITLSDYMPVHVGFAIEIEVRTQAWDPDLVTSRVRSALQDAFSLKNRRLGQALYRSEVFQAVENVAGVENSLCDIVLAGNDPDLIVLYGRTSGSDAFGIQNPIRLIRPSLRQCIHWDGSAATIQIRVREYEL